MQNEKKKYIILGIVLSLCLLSIVGCGVYIYLTNTGRIITTKSLSDGSKYCGYWSNGRPNGFGTLTTSDSTVYSGKWIDGSLPEAKVISDKYEYDGHLESLKFNGFGILKTKRGDYYRGYWQNGKKDGLGFLRTSEGEMEFGTWHDDLLMLMPGHEFKIGDKVYGIDISHHQAKIDWNNLCLYADSLGIVRGNPSKDRYLQPVFFVIVKSTEGDIIDSDFQTNFETAKRMGYKRGAYHYLGSKSSIEKQIDNYIKHTPLEKGDFPPILDLEIPENIMKANCDEICTKSLQWLKAMEEHYGVKPIVYTYDRYYKDYLANKGFDGYPFWMARFYGAAAPDKSDWVIWQFTDKGVIGGINRTVDIDLFKGNYDDLISYPTVN